MKKLNILLYDITMYHSIVEINKTIFSIVLKNITIFTNKNRIILKIRIRYVTLGKFKYNKCVTKFPPTSMKFDHTCKYYMIYSQY